MTDVVASSLPLDPASPWLTGGYTPVADELDGPAPTVAGELPARSDVLPISFDDEPVAGDGTPRLHRWRVDPVRGTVRDERLDDAAGDFPRVAPSVESRPNRYGYVARARRSDGQVFEIEGVTKHDLAGASSTSFTLPAVEQVGESVFAPDPDGTAEDDGWLLTYGWDQSIDASDLLVLDARDLAAGPVARVRMPRRVPLGFHGSWLPGPG